MKTLAIELTNRCNAKCEFCINRKFEKFGDMSDEIFNKVIRDAKEFDLKLIVLNNIGEPFLRKDLLTKIKIIRENFPEVKIVMFSNGNLLTIKALKELKRLKVIFCVSLNASSSEGRKRMGLNDYERVKKLIKTGLKMKAISKVTFVEKAAKTQFELEEFSRIFGTDGQVIPFANWAGSMFDTFNPKYACDRAKHELTVLFDGTVSLCCMTSLKVNFGNIQYFTLKEIWNSKERQDYKQAAEKGELFGVCSNCTGA
jgi:radical SAM protein with 4Fe4S-binding SPASM domain